MKNEREQLEAAIVKAKAQIRSHYIAIGGHTRRVNEHYRKLRRLTIAELVDAPNAVRLRNRYSPGHQFESMNETLGTITRVNGNYATVQFSNGKCWQCILEELELVDCEQACAR